MRKISLFLFVLILTLTIAQGVSYAYVYVFQPDPVDLYDLDHYYAYSWGIRQTLQPNEVIISARLRFKNINNWTIEDDDKLYIRLFNNAPEGVRTFYDDQEEGDYFAPRGIRLFTFKDRNEYWDGEQWVNPSQNYRYNFTSSELDRLNRIIQDGNFGFGFDPDCHYYNDRIRFRFETTVIPEPATMSLLGLGLLGLLTRIKPRRDNNIAVK